MGVTSSRGKRVECISAKSSTVVAVGPHTDAADAHARAGEGAEGRLGTGTGSLGAISTGGADLDVEGGDAELLALGSHVLGRQHGSVGGGLVAVSLDLHTTGDTGNGLTASQISDVLDTQGGVRDGCIRRTRTTKVSLKEAKMWATPKTSSPGRTWGPNVTFSSTLALRVF